MEEGQKKSKFSLKGWAAIFAMSFSNAANDDDDLEPVFNEAAGGEGESGGVKYNGFLKGILPGVRDAMMVDNENTALLRHMRANSAQFTQMHLSKG
ncbi:MAG: hypothetical protein HRT94_09585 [Alphaproteobacteria bacterium]|nr:hypothetical protein [Alphaproteobacteria bacterium]